MHSTSIMLRSLPIKSLNFSSGLLEGAGTDPPLPTHVSLFSRLGADATCQTLASNAGLVGTFQAWLADSTDNPGTRQSQVGTPYIRTDGAVIANDWADLTDGSIAVGISLDESGTAASGNVWSNVDPVGGGNAAAGDCGDWTIGMNSTTGRLGLVGSTSSTWSNNSGTLCNLLQHLYCVEQ